MPISSLISRPLLAPGKVRLLATVWLGCSVLASVCPALAADNSAAAAAALKVLLGSVVPAQASGGVMPTASNTNTNTMAVPALQGQTVTVQRGETLDRVIRRALPNLPLHPDFLRKAFVSLNPQAFPTGSPHLMRSGSTLQVPSMAALRQMMVQQNPATAAMFEPLQNASGPSSPSEKRRWVRFP